jgi:hypothetical protein
VSHDTWCSGARRPCTYIRFWPIADTPLLPFREIEVTFYEATEKTGCTHDSPCYFMANLDT